MKIKNIVLSAVAVALFAGCASEKEDAKEHKHETMAQLQAEAKLSKEDAVKIALSRVPNGIIKEGELEREHGKLIWSFDVALPDSKNIKEVNINAVTGEVIAVDTETPAQQAKEADEDKKEKKEKE